MSLHGEQVLAALAAGNGTSPVAASWRRSAVLHGLAPDDIIAPERDSGALAEALEREADFVAVATPCVDQLFTTVGESSAGGVSLTDSSGLLLMLRTDRTLDVWKRSPQIGIDVSEARLGTNSAGTCLVEDRPIAIRSTEHFYSAFTIASCLSAPIHAPDGSLAGCLTLTNRADGDANDKLAHMAVQVFAGRIEVELFAAAFPKAKLMVPRGYERHSAALLAVDADDRVVGATHRARQVLGLGHADLAHGVALRGSGSGTLADFERQLIVRTLARHDGNMTAAAREIGISRSTLYRKLR